MDALAIDGVQVPAFMYGTAWKEHDTARCVVEALRAGFRAVDTANQRKHYHEAGVGHGLARAYELGLARSELFLQTKFTYRRGQDHRLPYDPRASLDIQVEQSFASSLEHLQTSRLDSLVLHGPARARALVDDDWRVWAAMERLQRAGKVRFLGISNVELHHIAALHRHAEIKPTFVQNRCYARTGWDRRVRSFCVERGIVYQGFSLLTANADALRSARFIAICTRFARTPAQVVFRFAQQLGMLPLTGTTDPSHMREDLEGLDFELDARAMTCLERLIA